VCTMGTKLLTSAASAGRVVTDIDLKVDRRSGRVVSKTTRNITVTRDVLPDGNQTALIGHYRPLVLTVAGRPVGKTAGPILMQRNAAGESALGDLIADGMLEAARAAAGRVDVAFTNSGGIRNDLVPSGPSGTITYGDLFNVLPFGNVVIVKTMTGDAIARLLDQQFVGSPRVLQPSKGFTYEWDRTKPEGTRVNRASIQIDGKPLMPAERYRIATLDFVWNGGDQFTVATEGTDPTGVGTDVDIFAAYLEKHSPVTPGPQDRIRVAR
jgi:5'-nucleotidase